MSFILWDDIGGDWVRTSRNVLVQPESVVIDSQWYAEQGYWEQLAAWSIYEEQLQAGDAPLGYATPEVVSSDGRQYAYRAISGTDAEHTQATRQQKASEIDAQVPDGSARRLVEDPLFEGEIQSYSGGASERKSDLEDTADVDVDEFNTAVTPTPLSGAGFVQAKMTTFIDIVDPWAGAPSDIYALRCALQILTEGEYADGASARAHMFNEAGIDQGVISFTQDAEDPSIWWAQSQEGRYWGDPDTSASMRLLWDSGSLPVAETKLLNGFGDRQYAVVRAGLPAARGGRRSG